MRARPRVSHVSLIDSTPDRSGTTQRLGTAERADAPDAPIPPDGSITFEFDAPVVAAVLLHMNDDHVDDNVLIARAFGDRTASACRMTHVDGLAGHWVFDTKNAVELSLRVQWSTPITERAQIRREIVGLYDRACDELGIEPRPHD